MGGVDICRCRHLIESCTERYVTTIIIRAGLQHVASSHPRSESYKTVSARKSANGLHKVRTPNRAPPVGIF